MKRTYLLVFSVLLTILVAGCSRAEFNQPADIEKFSSALADSGLQSCRTAEIPPMQALEIKSGRFYELSQDCNETDAVTKVWVVNFGSEAARDAAFRRFTTEHRRGLGSSFAWTAGPLLITVEGTQTPEVVAGLRQAVQTIRGN